MANTHKRRSLKFDSLRDSVDEVHRLHDSEYAKAGNWSLAQCCQHLTKALKMSIDGAPARLPFFLRPIARWMLFRSVMNGTPTRLPLITFPQFVPDDSPDLDVAVREYETAVAAVMADDAPLLGDHPVFGRVTNEEWRRFHTWHAAHHLSYLLPDEAVTPAVASS